MQQIASVLPGRYATVDVGHRMWNGQNRNQVNGVKPYAGGAPTAPAVAPPAPAVGTAAPLAPPPAGGTGTAPQPPIVQQSVEQPQPGVPQPPPNAPF